MFFNSLQNATTFLFFFLIKSIAIVNSFNQILELNSISKKDLKWLLHKVNFFSMVTFLSNIILKFTKWIFIALSSNSTEQVLCEIIIPQVAMGVELQSWLIFHIAVQYHSLLKFRQIHKYKYVFFLNEVTTNSVFDQTSCFSYCC